MRKIPYKIFLQIHSDCNEGSTKEIDEGSVTWSCDKIYDTDVEYVRKQLLRSIEEDGFPEENTGVLFLVEWGKNHYGYFVGVYYGNGCWESDHRIFLPDSEIGKVTHWMPLPKKGGEE